MKFAVTQDPKKRLYLLGGALFVWSLLVCLRLVQLQVFKYGEYVKKRPGNSSAPSRSILLAAISSIATDIRWRCR